MEKALLKALLWLALIAAWGAAVTPYPASAQEFRRGFKESQIIGTFIYNLIDFVTWKETGDTIRVCIAGKDAVEGVLRRIKNDPEFKQSIEIKPDITQTEFTNCDILYISPSARHQLNAIITAVKDHPVLTVSDIKQFAEKGGRVGFVFNEQGVQLHANLPSVKQGGLTIDAELLEMMTIIE